MRNCRLHTISSLLMTRGLIFSYILLTVALGVACNRIPPRKSDAELGLTAQQASGRAIFDTFCHRCHEPYSSYAENGPSLKGVLKKPYFSSGIPANDERLTELIQRGRSHMPAFGDKLYDAQIADLIVYLHTL